MRVIDGGSVPSKEPGQMRAKAKAKGKSKAKAKRKAKEVAATEPSMPAEPADDQKSSAVKEKKKAIVFARRPRPTTLPS